MSFPPALDSAGLRRWATRTVSELSRRRDEINALNVFPVPDSDTGSNMAHTMEAALAEVKKGGDVAEALAVGSVRGARGNSGMVLSQVLRGIADATEDSVIDGPVLVDALRLAVRLVDRAIAEPVEGTVITVLRAAARAAEEAAARPGALLHDILTDTIAAARQALAETPTQLEALRKAGVVDAGGAGLLVLLESLLAELEGAAMHNARPLPTRAAELEVMFFFEGDLSALEAALRPAGTSLILARQGDGSAGVHIHTRRAGEVIEEAFALGRVSALRLDVLPESEAGGADACQGPGAPPGGQDATAPSREEAAEDGGTRLVVAVSPGRVHDLFGAAGARVCAPDKAESTGAEIVLRVGSGEHCLRGGIADGPELVVAGSVPAALAAFSVYDPTNPDAQATAAAMRDAAASMRVVRPAQETPAAVARACRQALRDGGEQVTIVTPLDLNDKELSEDLGVHAMVVPVSEGPTAIGVE